MRRDGVTPTAEAVSVRSRSHNLLQLSAMHRTCQLCRECGILDRTLCRKADVDLVFHRARAETIYAKVRLPIDWLHGSHAACLGCKQYPYPDSKHRYCLRRVPVFQWHVMQQASMQQVMQALPDIWNVDAGERGAQTSVSAVFACIDAHS